jgi:hypothetical protein
MNISADCTFRPHDSSDQLMIMAGARGRGSGGGEEPSGDNRR